MGKKIKNLTIEEIINIHNQEIDDCDVCPFDNTPLCGIIHSKHKSYLEKEIELKDKENE